MVAEAKIRQRDAVLSIQDFLTLEVAKRPTYIDPWFNAQNITQICGPRGIGKTWLALSIAHALSSKGSIGPWPVIEPASCLYVDAESSIGELQERLGLLGAGNELKRPLSILADAYGYELGLPRANLLNDKWRQGLADYLMEMGFDVLFLDNLASLTPGIDENVKKEWDPINNWLLNLRFAGISTIFMHHTNKAGGQRGTSGREDNINVSIMLTAPPTRGPEDGAKFTVEFSKCRGVYGNALERIVLSLSESDGKLVWNWQEADREMKKKILQLLSTGYAQIAVADELQLTRGYISRVRKKAIEEGQLTTKNELTVDGYCYVYNAEN